jgi:lambda repressor-like predicted transcriptional regulator
MNTAMVEPNGVTATSLLVENVRIYLQVKSAYEQCDEQIKAAIADMIGIVDSEDATPDERQRALYTIVEALFPSMTRDFLDSCERVRASKSAKTNWNEMGRQEASFAVNLESWMEKKGMTQEQLAKKIGVSQPAIANMLNRNCRPQKKTVARIADALGIDPEDIWPNFKRD